MRKTDPTERRRNTAATINRTENLLKIIRRLELGELRRDDMQDLLNYSPSGTRKYIADLVSSEVMQIGRYEPTPGWHAKSQSYGMPIYCINADREVVRRFVAAIEMEPLPRSQMDVEVDGIDKDAPKQIIAQTWRSKPIVHWDVLAHWLGVAGTQVAE